ncbi:MAG: galactokinase [Mycobacteriales bacterium]
MERTSGFDLSFGTDPQVVWAAPGRVNLIGEHTDYNDGFALPVALPLVVVAAVARRGDDTVRVASAHVGGPPVLVEDVSPGGVQGWPAYVAGVIWAVREAGYGIEGVDVHLASTVPQGSGLSSSAAVECSVAAAVDDLFGLGIDRPALARIAQRAENDFVGAPTGVMDQAASLLCTDGHALLLDARSLTTRAVPFDLTGNGLALLVVDTRTPHRHVDGEYAARRRDCERAARELGVAALRDLSADDITGHRLDRLDALARGRVRHIVTENARVLDVVATLDAGHDPRRIGPPLTASHGSLRDDFEVSSRALDVAVGAALAAGAHGARMTGGGFGGCAIALVEGDRVDETFEAVRASLADADCPAPREVPGGPAPGARKLR